MLRPVAFNRLAVAACGGWAPEHLWALLSVLEDSWRSPGIASLRVWGDALSGVLRYD